MKKKILSLALCVMMIVSALACIVPANAADMIDQTGLAAANQTARAWIVDKINSNSLVSFNYGDQAYADHIGSWTKSVDNSKDPEDGKERWLVTYSRPELDLEINIEFDPEFASLDWTAYFTAKQNTRKIDTFAIIDAPVKVADSILTSALGSDSARRDFEPYSKKIADGSREILRSTGGRSTQGNFSYFDLTSSSNYGVLGGIGWTGDWYMNFAVSGENVRITAGMQQSSYVLYPTDGEIRTPEFVLMFFNGNQYDGHNQFRQLVLKSYTQTDHEGTPLTHLPITLNSWGGSGVTKLCNIVTMAQDTNQFFEMLWVDAGWYGEKLSDNTYDSIWPTQVGQWYMCPVGYPDGNMRAVSNLLAEKGQLLMLWFEPERVVDTSWMNENSGGVIKYLYADNNATLVDFSDDATTNYMIDLIYRLIRESGVTWYRQDFNMNPAKNWSTADTADRVGITETKYITNLYRFLDTLRSRSAAEGYDFFMDNCASGGKRLDLEMMKRSSPMWRTDYTVSGENNNSNADGVRAIGAALSWWLPLSCGGAGTDGSSTTYTWRSQFGSGLTIGYQYSNMTWLARMKEEYKYTRELMTANYYPLSYGVDDDYQSVNCIYEFYNPETGKGYVIAFRPTGSQAAASSVKLMGLDANATYRLRLVDTYMMNEEIINEVHEWTGKQLMEEGLGFNFEKPVQSWLVYLDRI